MPSSNTLIGVAAFVVAALVAIGAVYALAGAGHGGEEPLASPGAPAAQGPQGMGRGMGSGMGVGPFQGGPGFGMGGGPGGCWMEDGMIEEIDIVEINGIVAGFDAQGMELLVETSEGETIAVKVIGVYVDSETGALVFGPWIAASLEEGTEVTVLAAEMPMDDMTGHGEGEGMDGMGYGYMSRGGHEDEMSGMETVMLGLIVDGKEYKHPMLVMSSLMEDTVMGEDHEPQGSDDMGSPQPGEDHRGDERRRGRSHG